MYIYYNTYIPTKKYCLPHPGEELKPSLSCGIEGEGHPAAFGIRLSKVDGKREFHLSRLLFIEP